MAMKDEFVRSGTYLFRWRSYLPLLFFPIIVLALDGMHFIGASETFDHAWEVFCLVVAASGLAIRVLTVGYVAANTSGRNTTHQKAAALNTRGMYSVVRHPLYLGNFMIWLGVAMFPRTWWLVLIATLAFWMYYERIMFAEEEHLRNKFGAEFEEWAARTPAVVPDFRKWQSATLSFSTKSVLSREHPTLSSTIVTFSVLEATGDFFRGRLPHPDLGWILLLSGGLVVYGVLRWMKKHGRLAVEGR